MPESEKGSYGKKILVLLSNEMEFMLNNPSSEET